MKKIIIGLIAISAVVLSVIYSQITFAISDKACEYMSQTTGNATAACASGKDAKTIAVDIIKIMYYAIGVVSVIVIIFSGILFITAAGNANTIVTAKKALLYAVVGLIIAILAYGITSFLAR